MRTAVRMPTPLCWRCWTSRRLRHRTRLCRRGAAAKSPRVSRRPTITDGQVLPFSSLNCAALTNSVSAALAKEAGARRDFLYGRAMAGVVAHEFYHVLMRTTEHGRSGVARSCFSTSDLLTERFEFEGAALARLRHRPDTIADVGAVGDESSDR